MFFCEGAFTDAGCLLSLFQLVVTVESQVFKLKLPLICFHLPSVY